MRLSRSTSRSSSAWRPAAPGFVSASIHRSTDGTRVFNYLQWETAEHLAAMQSSVSSGSSAGASPA